MRRKVFAMILVALITITAFAHPGRTDSQGGHTNHSTGKYHFHHGYPEHQHTGGVCPCDYDDKTGSSSSSASEQGTDPKKALAEIKEKYGLTDDSGSTSSSSTTSKRHMSQESLDMLDAYYEKMGVLKAEEKPKKKTVGEVILAIVYWGFIALLSLGLLKFLLVALVGSGIYDRIASLFKRRK